jgi:hypothetical protein
MRKSTLRWSALAASLVGIAVAVLGSLGGHTPVSAARSMPDKLAASLAVERSITAEFSRFALNALLVTLIDDDEPPRWSDVALNDICGPATHVEVDGLPLVHGSTLPAAAFTVRWSMDQCAALEAFELQGVVDLLVFHEDTGLSAVVSPRGLTVFSAKGSGRMRAPFASSMSLLPAQHRP